MNWSILARLVPLAMIWGSSFLFMRITVPAVGAGMTTATRIGLAAMALLAVLRLRGVALFWRERWKNYFVVGALNTAIPFFLFAYAAHRLPAGYSAIVNATVPVFTVLIAWTTTQIRPSGSKLAGVAIGLAGVAVLAGFGALGLDLQTLLAFGAVLLASVSYAVAALRVRALFADAEPLSIATGSVVASAILLLPLAAASWPSHWPSGLVLSSLATLGFVCTAMAYALYYWLLKHAGSERAVTVTLLVPVFAQFWGFSFLHEPLTWASLGGLVLVLLAMALIFEKLRWPVRRITVPTVLPRPDPLSRD